MKRTKVTLELHKEIANKLRSDLDWYMELNRQLQTSYTKQDRKKINAVIEKINKLRCWLDDKVFDENPNGKDLTKIYYGGEV